MGVPRGSSITFYVYPGAGFLVYLFQDVDFCKGHRNKIEVPGPLGVEDLISYKLNRQG